MRTLLVACLVVLIVSAVFGDPIIVGSKKFTESYVLAEIAKRAMEDAGITVEHRQGMGGTIILWEALRAGQISLYPEYTGTIAEEILKQPQITSIDALRDELAKTGIGISGELGFNNTYALVMRRAEAERLGIRTISDLKKRPDLKLGLTHEFLNRRDGWRQLSERYQLPTRNVSGIDHGLGYAALQNNSVDVKDAYSTDAKIGENDLVALEDDLHFFPQYKAVFLYRLDVPPAALAAVRKLEGTIDEARMIRLNVEAERTKNYAQAASLYFGKKNFAGESLAHKLIRWTTRHLELAGFSLLLAVIVGVPLGIVASRGGTIGHIILAGTGIVQTIPSLALLALLVPVPFFGISVRTAIAALFLYGLLPIVRNTATGLQNIGHPHGRMEPIQGTGHECQRLGQAIATGDVRELVQDDRAPAIAGPGLGNRGDQDRRPPDAERHRHRLLAASKQADLASNAHARARTRRAGGSTPGP